MTKKDIDAAFGPSNGIASMNDISAAICAHETQTCKHCGKPIMYNAAGRMWLDNSNDDFPQYCYIDFEHGSQLHNPKE